MNLLGNLLPSWFLLRLRPSCSSSRRPKLARMALRAENLGEARAICLDIMATEARMGGRVGGGYRNKQHCSVCAVFIGREDGETRHSISVSSIHQRFIAPEHYMFVYLLCWEPKKSSKTSPELCD